MDMVHILWGFPLYQGVCRLWQPSRNITIIVTIVFLICGFLPRNVVGEHGKEYKLDNICKNHFLRELYRKIDGAVLTSQNEHNLNCAITFQTHSILQRFMLRFDRLQLDCNDHLYIYDGAHAGNNFKADLSCRNTHLSVGAIYTRTNFVTLKYITDAWGTDSNGFRLVITAVKDLKHTCKDFRCTLNEFCVDKDLVCDGVNHCGDGSDEAPSALCANTKTSTIFGIQQTWFAVVLTVMILMIVGLVIGIVTCYCRKRTASPRHPHNALAARAHQPVNFPYVRIKRGERWDANGNDSNQRTSGNSRTDDQSKLCRSEHRVNGCHDTTAVGKLATPCRPQARAQRGSGPPLLPGKVKNHGSDSDISSSQKDEWFV
ncbi:uncharacterized protein loaf [Chelonus insularis]|uniref:uncharacterized protein loaf n=1 Tax=Chelonus insularis TaxID=460826 RepID=UPI00158B925E|nr:uncharacterized protein LOC118073248 [Chelonus insularis]XP_034949527.1 uncharacterized protein LOC118073248 [Chelonus insularis]XP_034949528.1 uncharacterized protein LOC118073248 [Chelonus insularis]XP_034949529.1 uncharacterized protein LOC118073248 [Chelonus insularis]